MEEGRHIHAKEIGEAPEEQIELLRANAVQFRESSPCLWGLMMRAADTIEAMLFERQRDPNDQFPVMPWATRSICEEMFVGIQIDRQPTKPEHRKGLRTPWS